MTRKRQPKPTLDRKQPSKKERSNQADRTGDDRRRWEQRSGEGSESALANLKNIERDREKTRPADDGSSEKWS